MFGVPSFSDLMVDFFEQLLILELEYFLFVIVQILYFYEQDSNQHDPSCRDGSHYNSQIILDILEIMLNGNKHRSEEAAHHKTEVGPVQKDTDLAVFALCYQCLCLFMHFFELLVNLNHVEIPQARIA